MAEIKDTFKRVEKMIKIVKIAVPRYMLLRAYYYMIQSQRGTAMRMLRQTKKLSKKVDNKMIYMWANHCQQAWLGVISSVQEDLWKDRPIVKKNEWDEVNANDSTIIPFTFPLPK
ncbi:hypothetical protein EAI_16663 [Harpegnathos saltator]|uniref:Uncharacterized protein n=2 Tax=Harpegnathos saltator TaxID=610380 RepID=E2BEP4_HARSA|nr:hypothetical protein EAI_16663 [Harpegnathos saltator]